MRTASSWISPPARSQPAELPPQLAAALGVAPVGAYSASGRSGQTWLLELASAAEVRALTPDFAALRQTPSARDHRDRAQRRPGL